MPEKLTQERLKELLNYEPLTGTWVWKVSAGRHVHPGDIAGCIYSQGYRYITIGNKRYLSGRLVFLYMKGYFPEHDVDHIDRVKNNDAWSNLREVSRSCNVKNTGNLKSNTSGVKGVCWSKFNSKWHSRIKTPQKRCHLGFYKDLGEAVLARFAAEQCLGWGSCDELSPAFQYVKKHNLIGGIFCQDT